MSQPPDIPSSALLRDVVNFGPNLAESASQPVPESFRHRLILAHPVASQHLPVNLPDIANSQSSQPTNPNALRNQVYAEIQARLRERGIASGDLDQLFFGFMLPVSDTQVYKNKFRTHHKLRPFVLSHLSIGHVTNRCI